MRQHRWAILPKTIRFDIQTDIRTANLISIWISNLQCPESDTHPLAAQLISPEMSLTVYDKRRTLAAQLVRSARARTRVTQRELAQLAGTTQAVVARIEKGDRDPILPVESLLKAAGYVLSVRLRRIPSALSDSAEIGRILALSPEQRLLEAASQLEAFKAEPQRRRIRRRLVRNPPRDFSWNWGIAKDPQPRWEIPSLHPELLLFALRKRNVDFVLTGALGARLHGIPARATNAEVAALRTPANVWRLAAALRELRTRIFVRGIPAGVAFDCSLQVIALSPRWELVTKAGRLTLRFAAPGTGDYQQLVRNSELFRAFEVQFRAATFRACRLPLQ